MEKFFTINTVDPLLLTLPENAVFSRLGRNRFLCRVDAAQQLRMTLAMQKAFACCRAQGRWRLLTISKCSANEVVLNDSWQINSGKFAEFAAGAEYLWLGAVTVGSGIADLIGRSAGNMADCAVYDAVGSECADQAIGTLQKLAAAELLRQGLCSGKQRFSIGYGNVQLVHQREVFRQLQLEELGMKLSESCIMQPEKSVSAFVGVNKMN